MGPAAPPAIDGYSTRWFEASGIRHAVYRRGVGPHVLLLHELPGLSARTLQITALHLVRAGFCVHLPLLFGAPGESRLLSHLPALCISRELQLFRSRASAPLLDWLRDLCRELHAANPDGPGVGVIGMCLTGNFAIALLAEPSVIAPVTCQPSLPLLPCSGLALGLADADLEAAKLRAETLAAPALLGLRYARDRWCPKARFDRLQEEFGTGFKAVEVPGCGHSTLVEDFVDVPGSPSERAMGEVLDFLRQRLAPRA
jgi:dienelactone hydrolase